MNKALTKILKAKFSNSQILHKGRSLDLPIIDLTPLNNGNTQDVKLLNKKSQEIDAACTEYGAFMVRNSNILTDVNLAQINKFFALPQSEKERIKIKKGGFSRGYIGIGDESGSDAFEVKEAFSYGYNWDAKVAPKNSMQGPNVWPQLKDEMSNWDKEMNGFFNILCQTSHLLTDLISIALGHKKEYLSQFCKEGDSISIMRLFHYFPYSKVAEKQKENTNLVGSSPHTDWGFLTLILQEMNVTGLQVFYRGEWRDIEPVQDTFVVNCGDYLSLLTGTKYISPLHRVISYGKERTSAVLFYYPSYEAKIPILVNQKDYSLFRNQTFKKGGELIDAESLSELNFGKYIDQKWDQVYRSGNMY